MIDLSLVIPAYNEEKRIIPTLKNIGRYFESSDINCEVIVVVNNSTDNTFNIVKEFSYKYPFIKPFNVNKFTGKGGAIAIGVKKAKGKYIAYQDADGSSHIEDLVFGYKKIKNNTSLDILMGSRYIKGASISGNLPSYRFVFSRLFNFAVRVLFQLNYADTQCAVKIMKKQVAKYLFKDIKARKWTVDVNLLVEGRFAGFKIVEYPIRWIFKDGSKLNIGETMITVIQELLQIKANQIKKSAIMYFNNMKNFASSLSNINNS